VFDQATHWDWGAEAGGAGHGEEAEFFVTKYVADYNEPAGGIPTTPTTTLGVDDTPTTPPAPTTPVTAPAPAGSLVAGTPAHIEFATPPADAFVLVDAEHDDDEPFCFRKLADVGVTGTPPGLADREMEGGRLMFTSAEEPTTFREVESHECWQKAMQEEIDSIEENETWSLVDLPAGFKTIGLKRVYKVKRDEHGAIVMYKARLVAKGYVKRPGTDLEEVYAPVSRLESVRLLLSIATKEGWEVDHMDVKSAFLNGNLVEEVYVAQPAGFVAKGEEHNVLKLKKALYGLRQAPRAWNAKLDNSLLSLGF
jgi:hypothetical protein